MRISKSQTLSFKRPELKKKAIKLNLLMVLTENRSYFPSLLRLLSVSILFLYYHWNLPKVSSIQYAYYVTYQTPLQLFP